MPNPMVVTGQGEPQFKGVRCYRLLKLLLGLTFYKGDNRKEKV